MHIPHASLPIPLPICIYWPVSKFRQCYLKSIQWLEPNCVLSGLISFIYRGWSCISKAVTEQHTLHKNLNFLNLQGLRDEIWWVWLMFGLLYLKPHPIWKERNCIWFELSEILEKNSSGNQDTTSILMTKDSFYLVLFSLKWNNIATAVEIISRMCWGNAIILRASVIAISEKTAHWTSTAASSHGNNIRMCWGAVNIVPEKAMLHLSFQTSTSVLVL